MSAAHAIPTEVLAALGRLNAYARGCRGSWTPREAIYCYKTALAMELIRQRAAQVRFVKIESACGCGDGWWRDWHSDPEAVEQTKRRCWRCNGSAKVALRFTETTLPDGQIWHHPWDSRSNPGYKLGHAFVGEGVHLWSDTIEWADAGEWRPRQPGLALPIAEVAELLNTIEDWFEGRADDAGAYPWLRYIYPSYPAYHLRSHNRKRITPSLSHSYQLDLGTALSCHACRALVHEDDPHEPNRYGVLTPLFKWTLWTCERHKIDHPQSKQRDLAPPDELLSPSVRRWMARHSQIVEVEW